MIVTRESINPCILCNVLAPIFICGVLGNLICILVFLRRRFRHRSISVYFIALFFNDCALLFISHVAKMLIFDASKSCWFNIYLSKLIDLLHYGDLLDHGGLSVLTYNTTYTQISMLIFMFMSIQRVRTFSSISYRESRMCAFLLTLIAFLYGFLVSYMQFYDGFCIRELQLNSRQTSQIDLLINATQQAVHEQCTYTFAHESGSNSTVRYHNSSLINEPGNETLDSICDAARDWQRVRHRTIAYVYLQSYMSIDWPDEYQHRSHCDFEETLPEYLRATIENLTRPALQARPGKDYFLEHQFCTQTFHFVESYANCSFPLTVQTFQKFYQFIHDRRLSPKNRYTIGFIIGTFLPSSICIISSFICLYYISNQPLIRKHSHSRAELRSLSLILVEILLSLMSALQSYVINYFTCHGVLFRMQLDNCYGPSSANILPMFLGSIVELFTSTSNILILMICGSQFRNELVEILHLRSFCGRGQTSAKPSRPSPAEEYTSMSVHTPNPRKQSSVTSPIRNFLALNTDASKTSDRSMDSLYLAGQTKDEISLTEVEQHSDEASQCLIKLTTV